MIRPVAFVLVAFTSVIVAPVVRAQDSSKTVWVPVVVTDKNNQLVTSLGRDDFTILANGEPRDVKVFSFNEMPMSLSLMFDVSGSMRKQLGPARNASRLIVDQMVGGDRVNIGSFDRAVAVSDRFTANRSRIKASLDLPLTGASSPCLPPSSKRPVGSRSESAAPTQGGGTAMWDAVWCGVSELQRDAESIRKVMILLTDGMDNSSRAAESDAVRRAQVAGIAIYLVGFLGIEGVENRADVRLRNLAVDTGGAYFRIEDKDPVEPVFARLGQELRTTYVLGFAPKAASGTLKVLVKAPGLTARARARY